MTTALQLYTDQETGVAISTHSMMKTFRFCPKQAQYKYIERLKPKVLGKPLRRGTWFHALLEAYYKGEDWEAEHASQVRKFHKLFDEEKEALGDLPNEMSRMMKAYLWHYKADAWKVHEVEFLLETTFPDGAIYRGKIDMLIEDQYGLWIVDHKTHKRLPNLDFRLLDAQSALYVWAAHRNKIPVQGHIWNYVRTKAASIPKLTKAGVLSRAAIDTDYPTYMAALRQYGLLEEGKFTPEMKRTARLLKAHRYAPGEVQQSTFFQRSVMEKSPAMIRQVAQEAYTTHKRMHAYPFLAEEKFKQVERNPGTSCQFMCSYKDLCTVELFEGNGDQIRRSRYDVGDPLDYYNDDASLTERKDDSG